MRFGYLLNYLFSFQVGLFIEIGEQEIEHNSMGSNEVSKTNGIVAIVSEEQLERVNHNQNKLNHLQNSQIFLPPQVFLDLRT